MPQSNDKSNDIYSFAEQKNVADNNIVDIANELINNIKDSSTNLSDIINLVTYPTREEVAELLTTYGVDDHEVILNQLVDGYTKYVDIYRLAKLQSRKNRIMGSDEFITSHVLLNSILKNKLGKLDRKYDNNAIEPTEYIFPLNVDLDNRMDLMWGKGSSLNELTKLGANCPEGFVISSELNSQDIDAYSMELLECFDKLGSNYVAVRSSATKEDGLEDSFAGMFETSLFVDRKGLIDAIKTCHNNLHNKRVLEYCESKNIDIEQIKMAVVIQRMLDSEVSGVMFSRNPMSQNNETIIEACFGVGEVLVSGEISADTYYIHWDQLKKDIREQTHRINMKNTSQGYQSYNIDQELRSLQKLPDQYIIELYEIAKKLEVHYGQPMDIERAMEQWRLYILQARPITTTSPSESIEVSHSVRSFIDNVKGEEMRVPLYNVSPFIQGSGWHQYNYIGKYYEDKSSMHMIYAMNQHNSAQFINKTKPYNIAKEVLSWYLTDPSSIDTRVDVFYQWVEKLNQLYKIYGYDTLNSMSDQELISLADSVRDIMRNANGAVFFCISFDKKILRDVLWKVGITLSDKDYQLLFSKWSEMVKDSFDVSRAVDYYNHLTSDNLVEEMQYVTASFFDVAQGNRLMGEINAFGNQWSSHKDLCKEINDSKVEILKRKERFDVMYKELSSSAKMVADYMQLAMALRDDRKDPLSKGFTLFFRIAKKLFDRIDLSEEYIPYIAFQELLQGPDYLSSKKEEITKRKDGWSFSIDYQGNYLIDIADYNMQHPILYDAYLDSIGFIPNAEYIEWTNGSPGIATWKVRVIKIYDETVEFNKWDILVTWMTRPEFVPIMKKASAVVTNEGSITCHAAIICREIGIPCIIWTKVATQLLSDNDLVKVDAYNGAITKL